MESNILRRHGLFLHRILDLIIYKSPTTADELADYFSFRWEILRKPLHLPPGSEKDEQENNAFHIAAYDRSTIIGVGRLHIEAEKCARIRYMAVHDTFQKQGIGSKILKKLEIFAQQNVVQTCWLYAREEAINFYLNNGYKINGDSKSELLGLKHERMEKCLIRAQS